ncbi:hypothetical protein [Streptomyces sp. A012304]|uniref:hypothetical protein n=1 Tax=Streptomyces sp. A012304 TaxID=375446 RepID=UPI0022316C3D|nr:hypothetical protein [Streptomyces sp. A012304]GKQ40449.1 hypothetical protein ALMP_69750 [Streptomyces sp. A012304]
MTLVDIAGSGLAELTCARLLAERGHRFRLAAPPAPGGARPLLLTGPTLELLGSLWDDRLLDGGRSLSHRRVRWGSGAKPTRFPQPARAVDGAELTARIRDRLGPGNRSTDPPAWTVTAAAPTDGSALLSAGRRSLLAGTAPLRRRRDRSTAELGCAELGWVHLTPLGGDDCLVQAMVPGPAAHPAALLERILGESGLADRLGGPPSTVVALAAAPRVHLAPARPPAAGEPGRLVVGAGALRQDPLSGTGTAQALRTAILAASVIDAAARGRPASGLCAHYTRRLRVAFHDHLRTCLRLYETAFPTGAWRDEIDATRRALRPRAPLAQPAP